MKTMKFATVAIVLLLLCTSRAEAATPEKECATAREAVEVLEAFHALPERGIPPALLRRAAAVVVFPGLLKLSFVLGGRYGQGVMAVREPDGRWGIPFFVTMSGASIGWQYGVQSADIVLVFKSRKSLAGLRQGKITLGADAALAAGPFGRQTELATDARLQAEIYSYARSRGVFAGFALEGGALWPDRGATARIYERPPETITRENVRMPPVMRQFRRALDRLTQGQTRSAARLS